jgi:DNA end-binding protein Ku
MIDLATHIFDRMTGHFHPEKFDDRYEDAMRDLIKRKAAGELRMSRSRRALRLRR